MCVKYTLLLYKNTIIWILYLILENFMQNHAVLYFYTKVHITFIFYNIVETKYNNAYYERVKYVLLS